MSNLRKKEAYPRKAQGRRYAEKGTSNEYREAGRNWLGMSRLTRLGTWTDGPQDLY